MANPCTAGLSRQNPCIAVKSLPKPIHGGDRPRYPCTSVRTPGRTLTIHGFSQYGTVMHGFAMHDGGSVKRHCHVRRRRHLRMGFGKSVAAVRGLRRADRCYVRVFARRWPSAQGPSWGRRRWRATARGLPSETAARGRRRGDDRPGRQRGATARKGRCGTRGTGRRDRAVAYNGWSKMHPSSTAHGP